MILYCKCGNAFHVSTYDFRESGKKTRCPLCHRWGRVKVTKEYLLHQELRQGFLVSPFDGVYSYRCDNGTGGKIPKRNSSFS